MTEFTFAQILLTSFIAPTIVGLFLLFIERRTTLFQRRSTEKTVKENITHPLFRVPQPNLSTKKFRNIVTSSDSNFTPLGVKFISLHLFFLGMVGVGSNAAGIIAMILGFYSDINNMDIYSAVIFGFMGSLCGIGLLFFLLYILVGRWLWMRKLLALETVRLICLLEICFVIITIFIAAIDQEEDITTKLYISLGFALYGLGKGIIIFYLSRQKIRSHFS